MTSLAKMLEVLGLFSAAQPVLSVDEIMSRLGYTRPTAYRYIRELCAVGLLTRFAKGYALGQRIIELDYIIRQADPFLKVASGTMRALADRYGCEVGLLSMFGHKVVTVHEEKGAESPPVSFSRGRPMPLFSGAGSKVMVAFLAPAKQRKLFNSHRDEVAASRLGADWPSFKTSLKKIRTSGYAISMGELDLTNVGVAAPVFNAEGEVGGALVLVLSDTRFQIADRNLLIETLRSAAGNITQRIAVQGSVDEHGLPLTLLTRPEGAAPHADR
jgi:DNA-binding IclR family transcriptional regulator